MKKSHLFASLAALSVVAYSGTAFAGPTGSIATGDWNTAGTWNSGVPTNGTAAGIIDGRTVTFQTGDSWSGGGWAAGLLIGATGGPEGWWGVGTGGTGTLNVTGGTLSTGYLAIGFEATGTMNVSGGNVTADQDLLLGWQGATGSSINVSGGTFNMAGAAASYNIGHGAAATFNVSGGTVNMNRTVNILNGSSVNVSGTGVMNVNEYFTSGGAVNVSGGTLNFQRAGGSHFGLSTTAVMTLTGGQVNAVTDLYLGLSGNGTVNQSGGTFSTGTQAFWLAVGGGVAAYNQSGGTLETSAFAGGGGTASYTFSGGTLKATGALNLATNVITNSITGTAGSGSTIDSNGNTVTVNAAQIALGGSGVLTKTGAGSLTINNDAGFSTGTWNVNAGSVDMVGYFNGASVNVAGGTLNINRVGGAHISLSSTSTATLSSGAINNTGDLYLGYSAGGNGTLNQSGGALGVTGIFSVGGNGGAATWNISGGTQSITGALDVYANSAININSGGTLGKAVAIQSGGVVNVNTGGVLAEGATVASGGLLKFNGGNGAGVLGKYITLYGGTVDVNGQSIANRTWDAVISAAPGSKITNSSATAATIANTVAGNTIWLWDGAGGNTTIETVGDLTIDSQITDVLQTNNQGITKTGAGTLYLTNASNDYRGTTTVSAGTLYLSGNLGGGGTVDVGSSGTIGGDGTITGSLAFLAGADFLFNPLTTLTVNTGTVSFGGFSVADLFGLTNAVATGTYTLIDGTATIDFTNVSNFGLANAYSLGGGKSAYFESGSLNLVVIPEPRAALLGGLGLLALLRRRRA
jgi:fibronectin-binding autotransporter adhesin